MQTALLSEHKELKAKIVEFSGYQMPLFYSHGMVKEHGFVREKSGLFDVSHMGQVILEGNNLEEFLSILTPTNFLNTPIGQAKYTVMLNENACPIDDLIIYKISEDKFFLILNASRKEQDIAWIKKHSDSEYNPKLEILEDRSLLAIQGPESEQILSKIFADDIAKLKYMSLREAKYQDRDIFISQTGYTGENGYEISIHNDDVKKLWQDLTELGVSPIGLGARDSLRLEAGYPLYGHELSEEINISNSTLKWIITSNNNFTGKDKILATPTHKRVAIKLLDKGVLRQGMKIFLNGTEISTLTSGAYIPSQNASIGQAYIPKHLFKLGLNVEVEIRNKRKAAIICKINFLS